MTRVFKTRDFHRWMRGTELTDAALCKAIQEIKAGLVDAPLGGGVFKKRVALPGRGKRGGTRTIIINNLGGHWFFVHGFEKSERSNISNSELDKLKALAKDLTRRTDAEVDVAIGYGALVEICESNDNTREDEDARKTKEQDFSIRPCDGK